MSKDWKNTLISKDSLISDAIKVIDEAALQIAIVVNEQSQVLGTVTDGDIRRGLMLGLDIAAPVTDILNRKPFKSYKSTSESDIKKLMVENDLRQIPLVNEDNQIVGLKVWSDFEKRKNYENTVVLMAGGFGKRLYPYTQNIPKPMLPVNGKPMLEHIIGRFKDQGFSKFLITLHYMPEKIQDYFQDGSNFQISVDYTLETTPLGTAGALSLIDKKISEPILISNGDVITEINYAEMLEFHKQRNAVATMAVKNYEIQHPLGVVETDGYEIKSFKEKPIYNSKVNAGIYILDPQILELLERNTYCDMPDLFMQASNKQLKTVAFPVHEGWSDIGRVADYEELNQK